MRKTPKELCVYNMSLGSVKACRSVRVEKRLLLDLRRPVGQCRGSYLAFGKSMLNSTLSTTKV